MRGKQLLGSQRFRCAVSILNYFLIEVFSFPLKFSLCISRTKCSKGGRICNTPSREGAQYM